jgi:hypothetical protein
MIPSKTPSISSSSDESPASSPLDIGDPIDFALSLAEGFATGERGYQDNRRKFLQHVYTLVWQVECDREFLHKFQQFEFWKAATRKPKASNLMRSMLFYTMGATSPQVRSRAGKHAKVLRALRDIGVEPHAVAAFLDEFGGPEPIYDALRKLEKASKPHLSSVAVVSALEPELHVSAETVTAQDPTSGGDEIGPSINLRVETFRKLINGANDEARHGLARFSIAKRMNPNNGVYIELSDDAMAKLWAIGRGDYQTSSGVLHFDVLPRESSDFLPIKATWFKLGD